MSRSPDDEGRPVTAAPLACSTSSEHAFRTTKSDDAHLDCRIIAQRLLDELQRAGVSLAVRRGRLTVSGLVAGLTPLLVERLRERQAEIIALLVEVAR